MPTRRGIAALVVWMMGCAWAAYADTTWTGGGSNDNWSTVENWSDGVPDSADVAIFDATTNRDCTLDQNVSVRGICIDVGYGGTISQGGRTITLGTNGFFQADGTFAGGTTNITISINGGFTQSGGLFVSTSGRLQMNGPNDGTTRYFQRTGGTFDPNHGEVYFKPTGIAPALQVVLVALGCSFYNLTLDYAGGTNGDIQPSDDFTVENIFRIFGNRAVGSGSRFNPTSAVTVTIQGDLRKEDGYNIALGNANVTFLMATNGQTVHCGQGGIGGSLLFRGAAVHTITNHLIAAGTNRTIYGVTVDKSSDQVKIVTDAIICRLRVEPGNTLDGGGRAIWPTATGTSSYDYYIRNYGTITNVVRNLSLSIAVSSAFYLYSGSLTWNNVVFTCSSSTGSSVSLEDDITIDGSLSLNGGTLYAGTVFANTTNRTIIVKGDCTLQGGGSAVFADNSDTLYLAGTPTQVLTVAGVSFRPYLVISNGTSVALGTNLSMASRSMTVQPGAELDLDGHNLSAVAGLNVSGILRLHGDETVTTPTLNSGSRVRYTGSESPVTVKNWAYKNLDFLTPDRQFNWTAGATYSVAEGFIARGSRSTGLVGFRSTSPGSTWSINTTGATQAVNRVSVQDSTALGPTIDAFYSVNLGNNVNWRFLGGGTVMTVL